MDCPTMLLLNYNVLIQNAAARILYRVRRFSHITPLLYELHCMLPVKYPIEYKIITLTFETELFN